MKCIHVTVQDMIYLYVVMLCISIKPRHLGVNTSLFESISRISCVKGYTVSIEAYGGWSSTIMSLPCFRQIRSAYYPEFGESAVGYKCYQLRFVIWCINRASARNFDLGPNAEFDEGGISTRSCFYGVRKYNKYKLYKLIIDFFVLAEIKY